MAVIAVLVAMGGHNVLVMLGAHKPWGWLIMAGFLYLAVRGVRTAMPSLSRSEVTKAGAYLCAAILALWAVLLPARWVFGSAIVAVEIALVFDCITLAAPQKAPGEN